MTKEEIQQLLEGVRPGYFEASLAADGHDVWIHRTRPARNGEHPLRCRFWQKETKHHHDQTLHFLSWIESGARGNCFPFIPKDAD